MPVFNPVNYPSQGTVYVPAADENLRSNYSRNPNSYAVNRVATINKVAKEQFKYLAFDPGAASRIPLSSDSHLDSRLYAWNANADPVKNFSKKQSFQPAMTQRYGVEFIIDQLTIDQAEWPIIADHATDGANVLMTNRTLNAYTTLGNSANWVDFGNNSINNATATSLGGGYFSAGTNTNPYLQLGLSAAVRSIERGTNAVGNANIIVALMSPTVAMGIAPSAEYRGYLANSVYALPYLNEALKSDALGMNNLTNQAFRYGLGPMYGIDVVVDPTVVNLASEGQPNDFVYLWDAVAPNSMVLMSRPGTLEAPLNTMSCLTNGLYADLTTVIEAKPLYQRTNGVISDNYTYILRPQLGYLITSVLATFNPAN